MNTLIALVGMPGSGKSSVGAALGRRLQMPFSDSDKHIEQRIGTTIREFFDTHGESAFRDLEEQVMDELTAGSPAVLATGGGAVLREANRQRLHERCTVVYLRASPEHLYRRLRHDTKRPLLQVADPMRRLRELFAERDPLYRDCAHFVLDTHGLSQSLLVNRILMQLELASPGSGTPRARGTA
ncbi:MAG: shikimate kinase [Pseudomonadota bacterium]|nr:shikimate kinase [Pseudomonadota bacterium]